MASWLRGGALVAAIGWPILLHVASVSGHAGWMPAITFLAALAAVALISASAGTPGAVARGVAIAGLLVALLLVAPSALVFGPPVAINVALGIVFARSLRRGREPLIAVFARLEQGTLTPELVRYTRRLTWLWTLLLFGLAAGAVLLAAYASLSTWSWFVNCATYAAIACLFVGEYLFRRLRFPGYAHASLITMVRNVRAGMPSPFAARDP